MKKEMGFMEQVWAGRDMFTEIEKNEGNFANIMMKHMIQYDTINWCNIINRSNDHIQNQRLNHIDQIYDEEKRNMRMAYWNSVGRFNSYIFRHDNKELLRNIFLRHLRTIKLENIEKGVQRRMDTLVEKEADLLEELHSIREEKMMIQKIIDEQDTEETVEETAE